MTIYQNPGASLGSKDDDDNYKISSMSDDDLLEVSYTHFQNWLNCGWQRNIDTGKAARDFVFKAGAQWDESGLADGTASASWNSGTSGMDVRAIRKSRGKSCYQINVIKPIYRQMYAEQMLSAPQADLVPVNDETVDMPTDLIEIIRGRYRYDCYKSNTNTIYAQAYQNSTSLGYGAFYLSPQKENPKSFNDELRFFPVLDATHVFFDPNAKTNTKQDGCVAGLWDIASAREIKCTYPDKDISEDCGAQVGDLLVEKDQVAFCNLYLREPETISIVEIANMSGSGTQIMDTKQYNRRKKQIDRENEKRLKALNLEIKKAKAQGLEEDYFPSYAPIPYPTVLRKQRQPSSKIYHVVHTKSKILKKTLLPIREFLPLIFVKGDSIWIDGREMTIPLCEDAVTPQQLANFLFSEIIDNVDKSFGTIILGHSDAIGDYLDQYSRPTIANVLKYNTVDGQSENAMTSKPTVINSGVIDPNLLTVYRQAIQDVYNTLGRSLENHGGQTNAQSGVAIGKRSDSGNLSVGVYPENLNEAIIGGAKCWMEWSTFTYDTERMLTIKSEDGKLSRKRVNYPDGTLLQRISQPTQEDEKSDKKMKEKYAIKSAFAFNTSDFSVECQGGTSFAAQREKAIEALMAIMSVNPQELPPLMLDLVISLMPFPFASQLKRRLRESGFIDQQVLAEESGKKPPPQEPSPEQKALDAAVKKAEFQAITDIEKDRSDRESAAMKLVTDLSGDLSTLAKTYATTPLPEIEDAMVLTEDILKGALDAVQKTV